MYEPLKREAWPEEGGDQTITFVIDKDLVGGCGLGVEQQEPLHVNLRLNRGTHISTGTPKPFPWSGWACEGVGGSPQKHTKGWRSRPLSEHCSSCAL